MSNSKPSLSKIMEMAQKMQENMKQTQQMLSKEEVTGTSGAGLVIIQANCLREILSVKLDESLFKESIEVVQSLIASAINDTMKKIEQNTQEKVLDLAKGFNLPDSDEDDL